MNKPAHGSMESSANPTFEWLEVSNADSVTLTVEHYSQDTGKYIKVFKKKGITGTSFKFTGSLKKNEIYRWKVSAVNLSGTQPGTGDNGTDGNVFMAPVDVKNHPANVGINFTFSGSVSKEVLCNYLSRSVIYSDEHTTTRGLTFEETLRFILNTGAKYIGRSACKWAPDFADEQTFPQRKINLAAAHKIDPEIVFEACIFECVSSGVNGIPIPDWVFKAFNKPVENRNFSYNAMIFQDGSFINQWGSGASVPDMTRLETQMFFYYRACRYIDAGYEGFHMGQVHLIGKNDRNFAYWTKVLNMIRDYAKKNARRKFVFINAHTHGIKGTDNKLLFDFHSYPYRMAPAAGSVPHIPTENNPQRVQFKSNYVDSIYGRSLGGLTHSGWSCNSLPYFVEIDNYWGGTYTSTTDTPVVNTHFCWGMDEISWFANQPRSYRSQVLEYAYQWVRDLPDDGFAEMPGNRTAYKRTSPTARSFFHYPYVPNSTLFYDKGFDDEEAIRNIWIADRKNR